MKQYLAVRGTQENIASVEVNVDTVYVRDNITRIETEDFTGWEYDEVQYSKDDYIAMLSSENENTKIAIAELTTLMIGGI